MHWRQPTNILWRNWPKQKKLFGLDPWRHLRYQRLDVLHMSHRLLRPEKRFTPCSYLKKTCIVPRVSAGLIMLWADLFNVCTMLNAHVRFTACPQTKLNSFTSEEEKICLVPLEKKPTNIECWLYAHVSPLRLGPSIHNCYKDVFSALPHVIIQYRWKTPQSRAGATYLKKIHHEKMIDFRIQLQSWIWPLNLTDKNQIRVAS